MAGTAARITLVASAACIALAVVALYARSAILDTDHFADRAVGALAQDEVGGEIAARFGDGVIERSPGLVTLRPGIESAAEEVVTEAWFAERFATGVRGMHAAVFQHGEARPALVVPGMAAEVRDEMSERTPVLASRLPAGQDPRLMSIGGAARERALLTLAKRARTASSLGFPLLVLGLLGLVLAALTAPDRRRGLWRSGIALSAAGGGLVAGWTAARTLTLEGFDTGWGDAVVRSIWDAYLGDLRTWSLGLAGAGIVIAAAAARPEPREGGAWASLSPRARGAALVATGALVLADRDLALDLLAAAAAGVLLYLGARHLMAGRARVGLAATALLLLAAGVTASASGPEGAPTEVARAEVRAANAIAAAKAAHRRDTRRAAAAGKAAKGNAAAGRAADAAATSSSGGPRICFASMSDARAAAEAAAVPAGASVRVLGDGRVCVRAD